MSLREGVNILLKAVEPTSATLRENEQKESASRDVEAHKNTSFKPEQYAETLRKMIKETETLQDAVSHHLDIMKQQLETIEARS